MTPKITEVALADWVVVALGVAVAVGAADVAVGPGAVDPAGTVVPVTRAPQDTVARTTTAGSSRRRYRPVERIIAIFA